MFKENGAGREQRQQRPAQDSTTKITRAGRQAHLDYKQPTEAEMLDMQNPESLLP